MENVPPPAEELAILERELIRLDARRAQLLARRSWLLTMVRPPVAVQPPAPPFGVHPHTAPRAETTPPKVQNLLLTLGGVLLTIAAIAFTLVSWGHMGIGGRSAVLGAVTLAALAAPVVLLRRRLTSTAESVAALGLVLMVLDAYALHRVALSGTGALAYTAAASAVLAGLWAAYGSALTALRIPLPVAALTAQLPLFFWALTESAGSPPVEWALLATAAIDVAAMVWAKPASVRAIALAGAAVTGAGALLLGVEQSLSASGPLAALPPALLLTAAAGVALFAAHRSTSAVTTVAASVVAGISLIAGLGGVVRAAVPDGWQILGYLLCAVALLAVVRTSLPRRLHPGLLYASAAIQALAVFSTLPLVVLTATGPLEVAASGIWSGAPADARASLGTELSEVGLTAAPVVLVVVAGALALFSRWSGTFAGGEAAGPPTAHGRAPDAPAAAARPHPMPGSAGVTEESHAGPEAQGTGRPTAPSTGDAGPWPGWDPAGFPTPARPHHRRTARTGALVLAWTALFVVPPAFALGYAAAVAFHLVLAVGAIALTVRRTSATEAALGCGLVGAGSVAVLSLATRPATFTVLGAVVAALAVAAVVSRAGHGVRGVLGCSATVFATALLGAIAGAAELEPQQAALLILAVPAATAVLGARLGRHPLALPLECTGAAAGLLAVVLAVENPPTLALVLALGGVIAAATAVRAERRTVAGYLAAALFVLATWVRLAASDVTTPEAYTLPVTVPGLAIGVLRRRRDAQASSWTAYGPGLAATLVPSLFAAWGDAHWLRPLLLGVTALAVTLAGARLRLQALLVIGGTVLALDALHELAPYVVQVVGALPRWLPPALAGLLLLAVGATYEQRMRDARRLRDTLGRMR